MFMKGDTRSLDYSSHTSCEYEEERCISGHMVNRLRGLAQTEVHRASSLKLLRFPRFEAASF